MAEKSVNIQVGPGFAGTLAILFIALKLLGYIHWSWLWVLSPLWLSLAVALAIWAVILAIGIIAVILSAIFS